MRLRHTGSDPSLSTSLYDTPGPYDCVILDMQVRRAGFGVYGVHGVGPCVHVRAAGRAS